MKNLNTSALDQFLHTDPLDVGCEQAMQALHVYAELFRDDPQTAGRRYPGIAAHLAVCGPCAEDLNGLLAAIHEEDRATT